MFARSLGITHPGFWRDALLGGVFLLCGVGASAQMGAAPTVHDHVLRVLPDDRLTREHLERATTGSATARELLGRIERLQNAVLILRANPVLVQQDGLLERGKFWVVRGHLYGLLEYQAEPVGSNRAVRILAHELAHALEVAITPRGWDTDSLRPLVLERERERKQEDDPLPGIETEFARAVGYRVQLELLGRLTGPSTLSAIADQTHLALNSDSAPAVLR